MVEAAFVSTAIPTTEILPETFWWTEADGEEVKILIKLLEHRILVWIGNRTEGAVLPFN